MRIINNLINKWILFLKINIILLYLLHYLYNYLYNLLVELDKIFEILKNILEFE